MIDFGLLAAVLALLLVITAVVASRQARAMRIWYWVALVEYLGCALYQYFHGADANGYRQIGGELASFLDANFSWSAGEMVALLIHQPSVFDDVAFGAGTNSASMCAAAGWLLFFVRGSAYAAQALVAGLAMFGSFGIYAAFRDAQPEVSPVRLFFATVLFPSVAFWVSALHKEAFCLMGMGLLLTAWRGAYRRKPSALFHGLLGLALVALFRAPVLPPMLLGVVAYFVVERIQKTRGSGAAFSRPFYFLAGLAALAVGTLAVGRIAPDLAIDRISESVSRQQGAWIQMADAGLGGGSGFDLDEPVQSIGGQLASAPLALVNALFRPQLFEAKTPNVVVSALEMTAITIFFIAALRRHGPRGFAARIAASPFLLMCAVITVVGCMFVGLTTRNFGTMARYRVPFLPFYGALLAGLLQRSAAVAAKPAETRRAARKQLLRRSGRAVAATRNTM